MASAKGQTNALACLVFQGIAQIKLLNCQFFSHQSAWRIILKNSSQPYPFEIK